MPNDLQTIDQSRRTPCSALLSTNTALAKLVDETHPHFQRLVTPGERAQLAALVPEYEAALTPANPSYIGKSIGMLAVAFPGGKGSDQEAQVRLRLYRDGLADVPADILAEACRDAIRTCQFFPTVKDLRDRCKGFALRQWRLARIRHLIDRHDREWREPEVEEPLTAEQQAKVDAWKRANGIGEDLAA